MVKPGARLVLALVMACAAALSFSAILPAGEELAGQVRAVRQTPDDEPQPAPPPPDSSNSSEAAGAQSQPAVSDEVTGKEVSGEPPAEAPPALPEAPAPKPRPRSRPPATQQEKHDDIAKRLGALAPRGIYLLIDTGTNRLYLMRNRCLLREAICSTGSGRFLPDPPHKREWTFDTPKGEFHIRRKVENPVWTKPDWAFIEDGEPIPKSQADRVTPDELGDYAMDLGDGYLIHGTLYERSLGMSVTHGCVRLGAKDLEAIFKAVRVGTPVYIF